MCLACPSGYLLRSELSSRAVCDGCVDANVCGDHGTCVDNVPPYVFEREAREFNNFSFHVSSISLKSTSE